MESSFQDDINAINNIPIVPTLLDVVCRTTGMGFAAIARVTEGRWITCAVKDDILFGLKPGSELKIETTICNEIRHTHQLVVIDNVDEDTLYCNHHTPAMYGFQSYISVPIMRKDGTFFGTLCAIDPKPAKLNNPQVTGMFILFADLISFHLHAIEQVQLSESTLLKERVERDEELQQKNAELQAINEELESFAYIASHDLQEPLRKIQLFSDRITSTEYVNLTPAAKEYFGKIHIAAKRMQRLIEDLFSYTRINRNEKDFEKVNVTDLLEQLKEECEEDISQKKAVVEYAAMCTVTIIRPQFYQLFKNLLSNSLKFSKAASDTVIKITSEVVNGAAIDVGQRVLKNNKMYCHITWSDNGIGFEPDYNDKIFKVFQRLNKHGEYTGTGMGLAIVKKIVENHRGIITAKGELNKGARFDIYIPQ